MPETLTVGSLFSGIQLADSISASNDQECASCGNPKSTHTPAQCLENTGPPSLISETSGKSETRQQSMCFAEDSPARTPALPGGGQESRASVQGYGENTPELLAKYDRDSSSWKTSQLCLGGDLAEFSETWPRSGMTRSGIAYRLPPLELSMKETGSGLLPTLTARDFKSDSCTPEYRARRDAMTMGKTLPWTLGGLLNPRWCEVFMGYPIGWTELEPSEIALFRKSRKSSGEQS